MWGPACAPAFGEMWGRGSVVRRAKSKACLQTPPFPRLLFPAILKTLRGHASEKAKRQSWGREPRLPGQKGTPVSRLHETPVSSPGGKDGQAPGGADGSGCKVTGQDHLSEASSNNIWLSLVPFSITLSCCSLFYLCKLHYVEKYPKDVHQWERLGHLLF